MSQATGHPDSTVSMEAPWDPKDNFVWPRQCFHLAGHNNKHLGIQPHLSTVYLSFTDGWLEITNKAVEQYVSHISQSCQAYWEVLMPMSEFAYHNKNYASIEVSPLKENWGWMSQKHISDAEAQHKQVEEFQSKQRKINE